MADQIQADAGTIGPKVSYPETPHLPINRREYHRGFFAARRLELTDALLELLARLGEDEEQEIHRRPRIVFALVPARGALFEHFVLTLFVLLDEAFEADVAPGFDSAVIAGKQEQQA